MPLHLNILEAASAPLVTRMTLTSNRMLPSLHLTQVAAGAATNADAALYMQHLAAQVSGRKREGMGWRSVFMREETPPLMPSSLPCAPPIPMPALFSTSPPLASSISSPPLPSTRISCSFHPSPSLPLPNFVCADSKSPPPHPRPATHLAQLPAVAFIASVQNLTCADSITVQPTCLPSQTVTYRCAGGKGEEEQGGGERGAGGRREGATNCMILGGGSPG